MGEASAAAHPRAILASLVTSLARARHAALTLLKMGHAQMTQMVNGRSSNSIGLQIWTLKPMGR